MARRLLFPAIMVAVSILLTLGGGEVMVRLLAPQDLTGTWLVSGPRGLVLNRASYEVRHQNGARLVRYRFNSLHQRGGEPTAAARKVLLLGDSFTFGWLLNEADTYAGRLQARVDATFGAGSFELLNASVGGWGTADELAYLEQFGPAAKPDLVVVFLSYNDIERSRQRGLYVLENAALTARDTSAGRPVKDALSTLPLYQWALEHSHLLQLLRRLMVNGLATEPAAATTVPEPPPTGEPVPVPVLVDPNERLAAALFGRIKAWCDDHGASLLVITNGWPSIEYPWMERVMASHGIAFADARPAVAAAMGGNLDAYRIPVDRHPNEAGAGLIADAAWPALEQALERLDRRRPVPYTLGGKAGEPR